MAIHLEITDRGGFRELTIEQDAFAGMEAYMNAVWPKALEALKSLCETN